MKVAYPPLYGSKRAEIFSAISVANFIAFFIAKSAIYEYLRAKGQMPSDYYIFYTKLAKNLYTYGLLIVGSELAEFYDNFYIHKFQPCLSEDEKEQLLSYGKMFCESKGLSEYYTQFENIIEGLYSGRLFGDIYEKTVDEIQDELLFFGDISLIDKNLMGCAILFMMDEDEYYTWVPNYGGKKWSNVCKVLYSYKNREINDVVFCDMMFDLEHNTGAIFNKYTDSWFSDNYDIKKLLDYRRYGDINGMLHHINMMIKSCSNKKDVLYINTIMW